MKSSNTLISLFLSNILVGIIVLIVGGLGWVMNIYKLTKCDFKDPYKSEILRGAGILIAPVGAVFGFLKLKDGEPTPESVK